MIQKEQIDVLMKALETGMNISDSCVLAGVSREWFYNKREDEPEFDLQVKQARMRCKERNIAIIQQSALKNWFAAAWWLERRHKKEFSTLQKLEHEGTVKLEDGDLRKLLTKLPPDKQQHYREVLAQIVAESKSAGEAGTRPRDVGTEKDVPESAADIPENLPPADQVAESTP